jgi:hypothetical protein
MLIIIASAGAGPYSLDALIPGLMNKHVARRRVSTGYQLPMPQRVD